MNLINDISRVHLIDNTVPVALKIDIFKVVYAILKPRVLVPVILLKLIALKIFF
jgi:hypothetical protein